MTSGGTIALVLILAIGCGYLASWIARSKGRSSGGWFVAGLVLGLMGVLIVALVPNPARDAAPERFF
jgi:hypothetical protein